VAGDSGGAPEAVKPGETGLVVDPGSPPAIAAAITTLLTDPRRAAAMGAAGAAWIHREYTWDHKAALLRGWLTDALATPPAR
jgi:phosphatidylinositol alpha-1,6-mannosyltransferase